MSDEEEEFNYEDGDPIEEEQEGDVEDDDEDMDQDQEQEQEGEDAEEDEDENSESSGEGSDAADSEDASSAEESGDEAMDEDEPQGSVASLPTKSPRGLKRGPTKSRETSFQPPERSVSPASIRRQMLRVPPPQCKTYTIEPVCAIPHPSPTNAMASSLCMSHLLTGSDDGFIRDYDVFSACNGRTFLTAPQRSHCGLGDTMMKAGLLRCWWPATTQERYDAGESSAICSMACHSDALWALSGNAIGEVHLYTVRHEPGRVHHTFAEHDAAVTALGLSSDEKSVFSGSHDGHVLQLDLDRGSVARRFEHPGAQITALGLRPYYPFSFPDTEIMVTTESPSLIPMEEMKPLIPDTQITDAGTSAVEEPPSSPADLDNKSEGYDPLFDDMDGGTSAVPSPKTSQPPSNNMLGLALPGKSVPEVPWSANPGPPALKHGVARLDPAKYADFSNDLLMTATFGGSLFLWDRRAQKNVGRLENDKAPPWCISACWSATGNEILAGRRNATVDVFDVRQFGGSSMRTPRVLRTLVNPADSKTVTCVAAFPDGRHMVCASEDNIRLWNVLEAPVEGWKRKGLPPFRVIPGHHGGLVSQILIDVRSQFMVTASSARQWPGQSTKTVLIHEMRPIL